MFLSEIYLLAHHHGVGHMPVSKIDRVSFYLWHTGLGTLGLGGGGGGGGR